ncbi:L-threonylcarbamoyladenylate synthase [Alkalitalea saponilacus]|uniref:Threonylcarbamoyl-AMP synthase n=1 Tax=Alkalitalea saponilacus TaxID=889453 RepID=A0A1T5CM11_9BACT|nr:L-threonylcarbamoyladenylate synthase [Alkalitalea saponilacus]ASB49903.1 threonylcarbamoyl-AMP synthase [Alkalitalea saponilacus]SKB60190.1 L-threonylcarbamoyladenylate synthase [Alkalitalea saponilacus]
MIKSGKDIIFASKLIREGKLVAFPTETVYGLGANGFDAKAVAKIFEAKKRPSFDPLILHISSTEQLESVFKTPVPALITRLAEKYWPGPFTIVAPKSRKVPAIVTAGLKTVAVRMPKHPVALKLIKQAGVPVAAPSANLFGRLSPTEPEHVREQLTTIDYLVEGGKTNYGIESTIVSVNGNNIEVLRHGAITPEQIKTDFPDTNVSISSTENHIQAPGQLKSHYSPRKPLYLLDEMPDEIPEYVRLMLFEPHEVPEGVEQRIRLLSDKGDLLEAASNMFTVLHDLESDPEVEQIYALKVKTEGIGLAIMDRMNKAAYRYSTLASDDEIQI